MSDRYRRKSLNLFRPPLTQLTPIDEPEPSGKPILMLPKKRRTAPFFSSSPLSGSPTTTDGGSDAGGLSPIMPIKRVSSKASMDRLITKARPKSLQKGGRPNSLFGSLRSLHSFQDEDDNTLTRTTSTPDSTYSTTGGVDLSASQVLYHGEVQTAGNMFRKKSQYFVLTDTHLVRFKSQARASEIFPSIPSSLGSLGGQRHSRMSSSGSLHDLASSGSSSSSSGESYCATLLNQIVAVYKLDDGRPYFSVEVSYLDQDVMLVSSTTLQLHDPKDSDLWLSSIRGAAMKARLTNPLPFTQKLVEYTARALEQEGDYDPEQFHMFKVVQRASKSGGRSSSDDLSKVSSSVCILAIGIFKVHLVPLPKLSRTASSTSLSEMMGASHGVTTLTALNLQPSDDSFSLTFRTPLRQPNILCLASFSSTDIALWMRQAAEYLRPEWYEQPFTWNVPRGLEDELLPVPPSQDDYQCLNRTLCAYCAAYDIDASKIRYQVNWQCEDAPAFELRPPADGRAKYSVLELLAIFRALRYNESFACISFNNVSLDALRDRYDHFGDDHVPWSTRSGSSLHMPEQAGFTLLVQEVQALAIKSKRLRRMDFSFCLTKRPLRDLGDVQDSGCGLCEALFPLCAKEYTNVDWIILNGIVLSETDIDYLYNATIDRVCHFRAIDIGYCGLADRSISTILQALSYQGSTMESIDLSGNLARLDPSWHDHVRSFEFMRKISLSNVCRTSFPEPLIPYDLLQTWKLQEIRLDRTLLNTESVSAIADYLSHPQSQFLRLLSMNQCQLTSNGAAELLNAMTKGRTEPRELHLQLTENRFEQGHGLLVDAISRSCTPAQMTMQMLVYNLESNFRSLLAAFAGNKTTKWLDVSKVSLPSDASEETCEALEGMFAKNTALEYLDISGEKTHIEAASLGRGLCSALGANALASILEENDSLQELHCEDNEISLQGFTTLVNSMEHNKGIQYLPSMDLDRLWAQKRLDREVQDMREDNTGNSLPSAAMASTRATVKKTLGRTISGQRSPRIPERTSLLPDVDIRAAVGSLSQRWEREVARLQKYLDRNYALAQGLPLDGPALLDFDRPAMSDSLSTAMNHVDLDKTPTAELNTQLGDDKDYGGELADGLGDEVGEDGEGEEGEDDAEGALEMKPAVQV